jgi:predicted nucleotidyltransferase
MVAQIDIPEDRIRDFCRRWKVRELALFGSVLREDFGPDSDVDVLVSFHQDSPWDLYDLVTMMEELKAIFGRDVDLVEREALRNPFRRYEILRTARVIYAA